MKTIGDAGHLSNSAAPGRAARRVGPLLHDRARGIDPRDLELEAKRVSISVEETFERDISDRTILHAEVRRMADELAAHMQRNGISGRTVTAKLRYADFSIRSRSTTLAAPVDEGDRIGELACGLLDRGLRDRPGRCGSSASASRASPSTGSSRSTTGRAWIRSVARFSAERPPRSGCGLEEVVACSLSAKTAAGACHWVRSPLRAKLAAAVCLPVAQRDGRATAAQSRQEDPR